MSKAITEAEIKKVYDILISHTGAMTEVVKRTEKNKSWVSRVLRGKTLNKNGVITGKSAIGIVKVAIEIIKEIRGSDNIEDNQASEVKNAIAGL